MAKRLLWIEDDAGPLNDLVQLIRQDGWEIREVHSEKDLGELLVQDDRWDVILLDILLPVRENPSLQSLFAAAEREYIGLDVLAFINEHYGARRPPVVALTVVDNDEVRTELGRLGVSVVLLKGGVLSPDKVRDAVYHAVTGEPSAD